MGVVAFAFLPAGIGRGFPPMELDDALPVRIVVTCLAATAARGGVRLVDRDGVVPARGLTNGNGGGTVLNPATAVTAVTALRHNLLGNAGGSLVVSWLPSPSALTTGFRSPADVSSVE